MITPSSDDQMKDVWLHPGNYSLVLKEDGQPEIRPGATGPRETIVRLSAQAQKAGEVVLQKLAVTPNDPYLKACAQLIVSREHEGEISSELKSRLQAILSPSTRSSSIEPKAAVEAEPEKKVNFEPPLTKARIIGAVTSDQSTTIGSVALKQEIDMRFPLDWFLSPAQKKAINEKFERMGDKEFNEYLEMVLSSRLLRIGFGMSSRFSQLFNQIIIFLPENKIPLLLAYAVSKSSAYKDYILDLGQLKEKALQQQLAEMLLRDPSFVSTERKAFITENLKAMDELQYKQFIAFHFSKPLKEANILNMIQLTPEDKIPLLLAYAASKGIKCLPTLDQALRLHRGGNIGYIAAEMVLTLIEDPSITNEQLYEFVCSLSHTSLAVELAKRARNDQIPFVLERILFNSSHRGVCFSREIFTFYVNFMDAILGQNDQPKTVIALEAILKAFRIYHPKSEIPEYVLLPDNDQLHEFLMRIFQVVPSLEIANRALDLLRQSSLPSYALKTAIRGVLFANRTKIRALHNNLLLEVNPWIKEILNKDDLYAIFSELSFPNSWAAYNKWLAELPAQPELNRLRAKLAVAEGSGIASEALNLDLLVGLDRK